MKKRRMRFPIWIVAAVLLLTLVFQTAEPSYASITTDPTDIQVTSYTVTPSTGSINRGATVSITLTVLDKRITTTTYSSWTPVEPTVSLNTSSFTSTANGTASLPTVGATGSTYTITFTGMKYTGVGNVFSCNVSYSGLIPPLPVGNISITLNQCVPSDPPAPPPPAPAPEPIPTDFVMQDAQFGDGTVYAGEQFLLSVTILTTNGTNPVENVTVTFSPPEQLTIAGGSSIVYLGTMAPNTRRTVSVFLLPGANIPEGSYMVSVGVSGVNQQTGMQVPGPPMTVSIPVLQPERFEIFDVSLPSDLTAGIDDGMGFSTVTLVNKGRGTVANVTVEIVGEGLRTDVGRQYLGNVAAGEQKVADFIMYADFPGVVDGYVVVYYENVRGEQMALERPFTVNVNEPWFEDPGFEDPGFFPPEEPSSTGPPTWLWIVIGAAAAAVVAVLLVRRQKKKKAAAEAALDDIDDDD